MKYAKNGGRKGEKESMKEDMVQISEKSFFCTKIMSTDYSSV